MPSEQFLDLQVSAKEAALIKIIRDNKFAKITVHMSSGSIFRVVTELSQMMEEKDGVLFVSHFAGQNKK